MKRRLVLTGISTVIFFSITMAQKIEKIEPMFWWAGMKNPKLQLLMYGKEIKNCAVKISSPEIVIEKLHKVQNPNYLFLDLIISNTAKPGFYSIELTDNEGGTQVISYELKDRDSNSAQRKGFNNSDVIYLIMPDRFSNGDPSIDSVKGMPDKNNRKEPYGRHGGDIQGVINHLDYLTELGVTTLWLTPVLENNQPQWSYHGYAITDFYKVDPRFGTNELYKNFVEKAHLKGLKVIKDLIFNHCGNEHWWYKDLPSNDWLNSWPAYTQTNYRIPAINDIHASEVDKIKMSNGWFDKHMPDLNQKNPFLSTYLIQNSIWWIEYANLDGIRVDTYPYPDKEFMSNWCKQILNEYPNFNVVGETWVNYPAWVAYWQKDALNKDGFNSNLPVVMDFPLMGALQKAFIEKESWDTGLSRLYEIIAHDFIYADPNNLLVFGDNHDVGRVQRDSSQALGVAKLTIAYILTTRGIPQLFYGTEIAMSGNDSNGHGDIRRDFPGGWSKDKRSAFNAQGRTIKENEIWNYSSKILNWRKNSAAIHNGKLTHFIPENEVYVYFRYNNQSTVMVILNNGYQPKVLETSRFNEFVLDKSYGWEIISGKRIDNLSKIQLSPRSAMIIELYK